MFECVKCGSINDMFTKKSGNNVGMYCPDCGAWQKWLNKNEARVFEHKTEVFKINYEKAFNLAVDTLFDAIENNCGTCLWGEDGCEMCEGGCTFGNRPCYKCEVRQNWVDYFIKKSKE